MRPKFILNLPPFFTNTHQNHDEAPRRVDACGLPAQPATSDDGSGAACRLLTGEGGYETHQQRQNHRGREIDKIRSYRTL